MENIKMLISIAEAAATGINRVRQPNWADPFDHIMIDIINKKPGPWIHLFCPFNEECNGRDPVDMLCIFQHIDLHAKSFLPYNGPLPNSEEYKIKAERFKNTLN